MRAAQYRANSVDEEARTAEFIISDEAVDTYRTVFLSSGWDLQRYQKNPVVTYQHRDNDADPDMVIGTSEVYVNNEKQLVAKLTFEDAEDNPVAEKVFRKVKKGILRGASIWAHPHEGRWGEKAAGEDPEVIYFTRHELMAWSVVTVQSNPNALARNAQVMEEIRQELPKAEAAPTKEKVLSAFEAQLIVNENYM